MLLSSYILTAGGDMKKVKTVYPAGHKGRRDFKEAVRRVKKALRLKTTREAKGYFQTGE